MSFLTSLLLALACFALVLGGAVYFGFLTLGNGVASNPTTGPHASFSFVPSTATVAPPTVVPSPSASPVSSLPAQGGTYTVQSGDCCLSVIAQKLGLTVEALIQANPQITPPDYIIHEGDVLTIPAPATSNPNQYVVKSGDSITSIATKYSVDPTDLADFNNIADWNTIQVGQIIYIPGPGWTPLPTESPG
jgi:LysM repeat protein